MSLVVLDRDGVINQESKNYIKHPNEWLPIPGSLEAIALLTQKGFRVVVATNQSGVGRGYLDHAMLNAIHDKMVVSVANLGGRIDGVFYCPHLLNEGCACRKPAPGMLVQIAQQFGVNLAGLPFVGDAQRDIGAAKAMNMQAYLVKTGEGSKTLAEPNFPNDVIVVEDLKAAAERIVGL